MTPTAYQPFPFLLVLDFLQHHSSALAARYGLGQCDRGEWHAHRIDFSRYDGLSWLQRCSAAAAWACTVDASLPTQADAWLAANKNALMKGLPLPTPDDLTPNAVETVYLTSEARLSLLHKALREGGDPAKSCISLGFVTDAQLASKAETGKAIARTLAKLSNLHLTSYAMLKLGSETIKKTFTDYTTADERIAALESERSDLINSPAEATDPDAFRRKIMEINEKIERITKSAARAQPHAVNLALRQQDIIDPTPAKSAPFQLNNTIQLSAAQSDFVAAESARIAALRPAEVTPPTALLEPIK